MPRFSLIVATLGRSDELSVLLDSLAGQRFRDFELIIVDQNLDTRVTDILQSWSSKANGKSGHANFAIPVLYLRSEPGVSRARNVGLRHSSGEIITFPDDDCWYYPDTLENVDRWLREHEEYGLLSVGCRDEKGEVSSNSWWQDDCNINFGNVFRTSATLCCFVRRAPAPIPLQFDEAIGPGSGTAFGCGEDTDFVISLLDNGVRGRFYSKLHVGHPKRAGGFQDVHRARCYGGGFGHVLAKHSCRFLFVAFVMFDFLRAAVHRVRGNKDRASQLWAHGRGIIEAYLGY